MKCYIAITFQLSIFEQLCFQELKIYVLDYGQKNGLQAKLSSTFLMSDINLTITTLDIPVIQIAAVQCYMLILIFQSKMRAAISEKETILCVRYYKLKIIIETRFSCTKSISIKKNVTSFCRVGLYQRSIT